MILTATTLLALAGCGAFVKSRADTREELAKRAFPPEGDIIDVQGTKVHAVVTGSGPDLVLIHGASGNTRDFTFDFVNRVKSDYRVIVFDRPGMGWTGRINDSFGGAWNTRSETPAEQASLLQAAAAQIGAERPIVLGHSYGGAVALGWALTHPDNLSGLVVVAGASNPWTGDLGPLYAVNSSALGGAAFVPIITAFAPTTQVQNTIESIFSPQLAPKGYSQYVGAELTLRRESMRANARQVNNLLPHVTAMSKFYDRINVPTEIIHGTADTIVPIVVHSEPLVRQIPGAVLTRLDGIGHMPHHAAPLDVVDAIHRAAKRAGLR